MNLFSRKFRLGQQGISLVEVMLAMGMMTLVGYGIVEVTGRFTRSTSNNLMKNGLGNLRQSLINTINNDRAWDQTKSKNPAAFACLTADNCRNAETTVNNLVTINPNLQYGFALFDAGGNLVMENPHGFTASGARCNNFPAPNCPLQISLKWHAVCTENASNVCPADLRQKVKSVVEYNPGANNKSPLNPANYEFEITRGTSSASSGASLLDVCAMLQGEFDEVTNNCTLPIAGECAAGEFLAGFNADLTRNCKQLPVCPSGTVLRGINSDSTPVCDQLTYDQMDNTNMSCPAGKVMRGIDLSGNVICVTDVTSVNPPPPLTCGGSPNGTIRSNQPCPPGQTGSISQRCVAPNWQTISSTCTTPNPNPQYAWVWVRRDNNGCHENCVYHYPNQPACTASIVGRQYDKKITSTNDDENVYKCTKMY